MKFLADENLEKSIVEALRAEGHDVLYMAETDSGVPDDFVLGSAHQRKAILVTDDKDFGEMVFRQRKDSAGVLLVRLEGLSAQTKADIVSRVIHRHASELSGAFSVISHNSVRIRRGI